MQKIAFIPVRGGSKSIPLKNIRLFCSKPLVYWTSMEASKTTEIDEVVVATDSDQIADELEKFELPKVSIYRRSHINAQDHSSTESVMIEYIENRRLNSEDIFILVQATSPLLKSTNLTEGIRLYLSDGGFDSVLSCVRIKRFFWDEKGNPINYDFRERPRRQDFAGTYMENGAFYISSIESILRTGNRLSGKVGIVEMPEYTAGELDEEQDWTLMESLMRRNVLKRDQPEVKLIISDVDGVLTDSGMYYSERGDELKKFNTRDGMGFQLAREAGYLTGIITSEETALVTTRAQKLQIDYVRQGKKFGGKLEAAMKICEELSIGLENVAYIGDDVNCFELLSSCGLAACPSDANKKIKSIPNIKVLNLSGGQGVFREFVETIL